ncbi:hypothetical protein GCM10010267_25460 [Streptomyces griseorubens]|nr:hypothetical protein GCM10010267_25460 [Streptomyces griseorubens]
MDGRRPDTREGVGEQNPAYSPTRLPLPPLRESSRDPPEETTFPPREPPCVPAHANRREASSPILHERRESFTFMASSLPWPGVKRLWHNRSWLKIDASRE